MEIINNIEGNIDNFSPKQCVQFLKETYSYYYQCLSSKTKFGTEPINEHDRRELKTIPLNKIKEKAQSAMITSISSALDNNIKLLSSRSFRVVDETFVLDNTEDTQYIDMRVKNLQDLAHHFVSADLPNFTPHGEKVQTVPDTPPTKEAVTVTSNVGFACLTAKQVTQLSTNTITPVTVNPNAVLLAAQITDLCYFNDEEWKPKTYSNNFFSSNVTYTHVSTELAHKLNNSFKPAKPNLKGVNLSGLLAKQITTLLSLGTSTKVIDDIRALIATLLQAKNSVRFKHTIGDFETGTIEHTLKVNQSCQGIRGGDDRDNSPADYSYFTGVALDRRMAKAFVYSHDLQRLFDRVHMPLKLMGKDIPKRLQLLYTANTYYGLLSLDYVPVGFMPLDDESGVFRKPGISFLVVTNATNCLHVFFNDMDENIARFTSDWVVTYRSLRADDSEFLFCTGIHALAGFASVGAKIVNLPKVTENVLSTVLEFSRAVNRARTFFTHFVPFRILANKYGYSFLVPRVQQIATSLSTVEDRYEDLANDIEFVKTYYSATMDPKDYAEFVEEVRKNQSQDSTGYNEFDKDENENDKDYDDVENGPGPSYRSPKKDDFHDDNDQY